MHRFFLPPEAWTGPTLTLSGAEAHHALDVLRLRVKDRVGLIDGAGTEAAAEVTALGKKQIELQIIHKHSVPRPSYAVTLIQAVTKAKSMDLIIQKAAELGARRIVPILSDRSVSHVEEEAAESKIEKWRGIAIEALKQCGSAWLPEIEKPVSSKTFLNRSERFDLSLLASLQPGAQHPRRRFETFAQDQGRAPKTLAAWIGPEGDFTPAELNAIQANGALPISLGPLVLRSETAAIYIISVLNYELSA